MKTKLLLFAVSAVFSFSLLAGNVTPEQAQKVALNFYFEKFNRFEGQVALDQLRILTAYTETDGIENFYYVFRISQGGFVVVSADDRLNPVLGYSFKNDFGFENQPPNVQWWFQQYADQVKYVREKQSVRNNTVAGKWDHYLNDEFPEEKLLKEGKEVEPLLTTEWDQDWPYNYFCPSDPAGPGGHAYAGCVATAAAQIGYYWRWPDHGQGFTSYIPPSHPEYGIQYADFENMWYRYDEMCDKPEMLNLAIAEYIYHVGVGVHMDYDPNGSAPTTDDSVYYFFKYFPFEWIERDTVPNDDWKTILVNNLNTGFPIFYTGQPASGAGHAFVCDGYQDEDYYHFNLGWGGQLNGYYTVDDIYGFNFHQSIVSCFCPDTLQFSYPQFCTGADTCSAFVGSITDGSGPIHNYLNNTTASWLIDPQTEFDSVTKISVSVKRFDLFNDGDRLYIYDGEDNSAPLLAELSGSNIPGDIESSSNKVFIEFITDGSDTAPGFYLNYRTVRPVWCSGMTQMTAPAALFDDGSGSFHYYNSTTCTWLINPGTTDPLTLHFNYFDTEEDHDVLKVYDGGSQTLLTEISGFYATPPEPITAPSGKMMLAFMSNNSTQGQGWEVWYDINTGIPGNPLEAGLSIIPNPANDKITISLTELKDNIQLSIFTNSGEKIIERQLSGTETQLDISALPQGVYIVRLQDEKLTEVRKLVKQ